MQQIATSTRCWGPAPARCCRLSVRCDAGRPSVATNAVAAPPRAAAGVPPLAGAGVAEPLSVSDVGKSTNIRYHEAMVDRREKELLLGQASGAACVPNSLDACDSCRGG